MSSMLHRLLLMPISTHHFRLEHEILVFNLDGSRQQDWGKAHWGCPLDMINVSTDQMPALRRAGQSLLCRARFAAAAHKTCILHTWIHGCVSRSQTLGLAAGSLCRHADRNACAGADRAGDGALAFPVMMACEVHGVTLLLPGRCPFHLRSATVCHDFSHKDRGQAARPKDQSAAWATRSAP